MNNKRRAALRQCETELKEVADKLQSILIEEQDCFDNMPEGLQSSLRGMDSEDAIDNMEGADGEISDAIKSLGKALEYLDDII